MYKSVVQNASFFQYYKETYRSKTVIKRSKLEKDIHVQEKEFCH